MGAKGKWGRPKKPRRADAMGLVLLTGLFVLLAGLAVSGTVSGFERRMFDALYGMSDALRGFALVVTQAGSVWVSLGVVGLLLVTRWNPRAAVAVFRNCVLAYSLVLLTKMLVARPRPAVLLDGVLARESYTLGDQGFPSGHTVLATVVSLTIIAYLPKRLRWVAIPWILFVAWSRVYLGVHVPLDVLGGFVLGLIVVWAAKFLPEHR